MSETVKLTQFSRHGGCGCKIAPEKLVEIIRGNQALGFESLLVGNAESDDAAVYDLGNGMAVVSTVDFFMPVVDDAFQFGSIAAANALSDVYAMGGKPLMAVAILGFPLDKIPVSVAVEIKNGAEHVCTQAGVPIAGGHSVDSVEPFFGLAVTGMVEKQNIKRNHTAHPGDLIFITKPIGTGVITSALKRGVASEQHLKQALQSMTALNKIGYDAGQLKCVTAMTDITGFGLAGHLKEMCGANNLSVKLFYDKIPLLDGVKEYLSKFIYPDMTTKIYSGVASQCNELSAEQLFVLCDPQTNGGLLIAVSPQEVNQWKALLEKHQITINEPIGVFESFNEKMITVV